MYFFLLAFFLFSSLGAVDYASIFPKNIQEMETASELAQKNASARIQAILSIAPEDKTFENTVLAFDQAAADLQMHCNAISIMKYVHPDSNLSRKAEELLLNLNTFSIDSFETNKEVYQALNIFKNKGEALSSERQYYLENLLTSFKKSGILLNSEDSLKLKELLNKNAALSIQFRTNIDHDATELSFTKEELLGLDEAFIQSLSKTEDEYLIACNPSNAMQVLRYCSSPSTRKKFHQAYRNRAYPQNLAVLEEIINHQEDLAKLLGYKSYAELDISDQMAKTPERVHEFISQIKAENYGKIEENWKALIKDLPESVYLTLDGKVNAWDAGYIIQEYSKKHWNIDTNQIAEYFPFQATLDKILAIFSQFYDLTFTLRPQTDLWHQDVIVVEVKEEQRLIGHLLLDLFPRKNKFNHACCSSIIPPKSLDGGSTYEPALAAILANLSSPSFLKATDIRTFMHEFGHGMHALLGRAEMPTKSGYQTPMDFAEAPSQLMEEWSYDKEILKKISSHYQTGEPLPDFMIDGINQSRSFSDAANMATSGGGDNIASQAQFALFSLKTFEEGKNKDLKQIEKDIYLASPQIIAFDEDSYFYCSFGHLASYGAKYYCYPWSKQLAKQMFHYIKANGGLLDPAMGKRYREKVIGKGGSQDPNELMADFLGARE